MELKFPQGFLWGAATAAHQVEGGNANNWSEWEQKNANRLAREAAFRQGGHVNSPHPRPPLQKGRENSPWPDYILQNHPNPLEPENYISGQACDHYNRFSEDFDIAKSLGHNAYRFSIEWSRVEPEEGKFDEEAIEHYRQVILALRQRQMEPFVTLWHWTDPLWVRDKGGWASGKIVDYFSRYAAKVVEQLGEDVKFWITLNEPEIFTGHAYLQGSWPPQKRDPVIYWKVIKNMARTHRAVYRLIKKSNPGAQIGVAKNNIYFEAYKNRLVNVWFKKMADWWWNYYFLNRIAEEQDFIGLNNYFHNRINYGFGRNADKETSDMGWELYPEAIFYVLKDLKKYHKPIFITENGLADAQDAKRAWFIKETLKNTHRAIQDGADVRGYFYWSLLDNFEWDKGFWPRFGLVEVDYKSLERKIRPSAWAYAKICKSNSIQN